MYNCYKSGGTGCTNNALLACYACYCEGLYRAQNPPSNSTGLSLADFTSDAAVILAQSQCKAYFTDTTTLTVARWGLVAFTVAINYVLQQVILYIATWTKSHSKAEEEATKMVMVRDILFPPPTPPPQSLAASNPSQRIAFEMVVPSGPHPWALC